MFAGESRSSEQDCWQKVCSLSCPKELEDQRKGVKDAALGRILENGSRR